MTFKKTMRWAALASVASVALAACSDTTIATPGTPQIPAPPPTAPPPPPPPPPPSGAGFAARSTAPASAADCAAGTSFIADVTLTDGQTSNFCSLTPFGGGTITGTVNIPFSADPLLISGTVFIGDAAGASASVTFAAGQEFVSASQAGVVDLVVVSRGSQLTAVGTASNPIVFTSMQDFVDDELPNGTSGVGDWGGLAINGAAPLNECTVDNTATPGTDGCEQNGEGGSGVFGGGNPTDDSGDYAFIRVQHAGFLFNDEDELNGIALQGVGNGTRFENIQVHLGNDDGFEWFGGTVNARNLIVTGAEDDSLDWTDGWVGNLQFALVVQNPGDDNGIEGDNNGNSDIPMAADLLPRSNPNISNITFIGGGTTTSGEGILFRDGSDATLVNAIITNFSQGFEFDEDTALATPTVDGSIVAGNGVDLVDSQAIFAAGTGNVEGGGTSLDGVLPGPAELAANAGAIDPTTLDPSFFTAGQFVGAFSPGDTADNNFTTGWAIAIPGAEDPGCPAGTTEDAADAPSAFPGRSEDATCVINTPVSGEVTLTAGNLYRLDGSVFVGADAGSDPENPTPTAATGTLTVEPGVTIFGNGAAGQVDLLTVSRGSQIFVNGSSAAPVVLTSRADLENGGDVRAGVTGEIGGLAINGRAPVNECTIDATAIPGSVDCEQNGEGGSGLFGGATLDDNSGVLNFLQIRYAGFLFNDEDELNGLALQGVGSGTEIDFIQILNGNDDGVEWFGGTASASHIVVTGAEDDSLDWTDGWTGTAQYVIVIQNPGDDNGIEADNNGNSDIPDAANLLPRSRPVVANLTLIGGGDTTSGEGILLRDGGDGAVVNAIVTGFGQGLEFDNDAPPVAPTVDSVALSGNGENQVDTDLLDDASDNILEFANNTLGAIAGFSTPLAPGTNETAPTIVAANPVTVCEAEFADIPANEAESDPAAAPFTALPSPCDQLDPAEYIGALADENDLWFAGWTIGL
ncbi:MAG: hypothetical protein AAF950_11325 [Pseudomonadota bacterium]